MNDINEVIDSNTLDIILNNVEYPASKADLIESAKQNLLSDEGMAFFGDLPDYEYQSPLDVMQAFNLPKA